MKICLKSLAKESKHQQAVIDIQTRLPYYVNSPCILDCDFYVELCNDYYLIELEVSGIVKITCQRCLQIFSYPYKNQTQLAVCRDEAIAERLMENFETIVTNSNQIELNDIITDELYLYVPEKHAKFEDCDSDVSNLIGDKIK